MTSIGRISLGWIAGEWQALMIHEARPESGGAWATVGRGDTREAALVSLAREVASDPRIPFPDGAG